jgi:hypothetical protein
MNRISKIKQIHNEELEASCKKNNVSFTSVQLLLEAEKTKKLLKRNSLIQTNIDKEINNALDDENK